MQRFLRRYRDWVLIGIAVLFIAAVLVFTVLVVRTVSGGVATAVGTDGDEQPQVDFRIEDAKQFLSARGLMSAL